MSTKIHNAYILKDNPSLFELKLRINELRKKAHQIITQELIELATKKAVNLIDSIALNTGNQCENENTILNKVLDDIEEKHIEIETSGRRNPDYDFYFSLYVFPLEDKVLLKVNCERDSLSALLSEQTWLESYSYWNNTDKPAAVSEEEWDQRKKDWDKALENNDSYSENGFEVKLNPHYLYQSYYPKASDILKHIPSYEKRLERLAKRKVIDLLIKKAVDENGGDFRGCFVFHAFDDVDKPEHKKLLDKTKTEFSEKIPKEITEELLTKEHLFPYVDLED